MASDRTRATESLVVRVRGRDVLTDPLLNKGTAFPHEERRALGISGLLPYHVSSLEEQVARAVDQLEYKTSDLQKHIYLAGLHDRNETLFYRVVLDRLEETVPLIYTPTVADACKHWSRIFRRARGLYITPGDRGSVVELLRNGGVSDARIIVITDNERILGIGDQGAGGMGIPIGKLALYTAGAGIHPSGCLPISLDVGTDNPELLDDPLYLGVRTPRLRGDEYWSLVEEVVTAIEEVHPEAILQWEDFGNSTSFRLLDSYRDRIPSFNDDIQGTASMVVGGLLVAMRATGGRLSDQRFVIAGAGSAGIGIFRQIKAALALEGLSEAEAQSRVMVTDSRGLVVAGDPRATDQKAEVATSPEAVSGWEEPLDLATVVGNHRPTVLIGVTGTPGTFTREMLEGMAAAHERVIVMPLSNPTSFSEVEPADALEWTGGRALVATGSPFDDVAHRGRRHQIGQANNMFIFPGLGLGAMVARARTITIPMFLAAGQALASQVTDDLLEAGSLYPPISEVRSVSREVAIAVAEEAVRSGVGRLDGDVVAAVEEAMWRPEYVPYAAG